MFIVYGLCIHIIFLFSIIDIYFKSPVVRGVTPYKPQHDAGADRLVLFVIDGLPAESFVNYTAMPYLRSVASSVGRWGISHTRAPTESRPGHVAILGGFYEDPSAVANRWKKNPVAFDSVFNQSQHTWCWGTYDLVDFFEKGTVFYNHIYTDLFDQHDERFSTSGNTTLLDYWVFEKVKQFFELAQKDNSLKDKLNKKKVILFLYLLGTDIAGHRYKPNTQNYFTNLELLDTGVKKVQKIIEEFYNNDNKTTFLLTSDHGMTDWGIHGSGSQHETETAYVLWGSAVKKITITSKDVDVVLPMDRRVDIQQADLAPLMSTILAIPVPVNSIGKLPINILDISLPNKAKAMYSNGRQLASQYNSMRLKVESKALASLYQPYEPFNKRKFDEMLDHTEKLLAAGDYEKSILLSEEIMNLSLSGLVYYHNYYKRSLQILITLSFVGWILYLLNMLLKQKMKTQVNYSNRYVLKKDALIKQVINIIAIACGSVLCYLVYVQNLPLQYIVYCLLPVYLWWNVIHSLNLWIQVLSLMQISKGCSLFTEIMTYLLGSLVMGISFSHRWTLSIPLMGIAVWPLFKNVRLHLSKTTLIIWTCTCVMLSVFSFMPVVGKDVHIELVIISGCVWCYLHIYFTRNVMMPLNRTGKTNKNDILYNLVQTVLLLLALHNVYVQSKRFENDTAVIYEYQVMAWGIAALSLILPLTSNQTILCRLFSINISILTVYLLLSVSHEGLFLITLMLNVWCWIYIELKLNHSSKLKIVDISFALDKYTSGKKTVISEERGLSRQDFRRAFFFLIYIVLSFLGTANIASLNSLEVRWVTCFITSYKPLIIKSLILFKTLIPIVSVGCSFCAVQLITKAPIGYLNIIVLIYSNIMGIQLLFQVKNVGSWLEIGTSISHFVIIQVLILLLFVIHYVAKVLTHASVNTLAYKCFRLARSMYMRNFK